MTGTGTLNMYTSEKLVYRACPTCKRTLCAWTEEYYRLHRHDSEVQWDKTIERHNELWHKENK